MGKKKHHKSAGMPPTKLIKIDPREIEKILQALKRIDDIVKKRNNENDEKIRAQCDKKAKTEIKTLEPQLASLMNQLDPEQRDAKGGVYDWECRDLNKLDGGIARIVDVIGLTGMLKARLYCDSEFWMKYGITASPCIDENEEKPDSPLWENLKCAATYLVFAINLWADSGNPTSADIEFFVRQLFNLVENRVLTLQDLLGKLNKNAINLMEKNENPFLRVLWIRLKILDIFWQKNPGLTGMLKTEVLPSLPSQSDNYLPNDCLSLLWFLPNNNELFDEPRNNHLELSTAYLSKISKILESHHGKKMPRPEGGDFLTLYNLAAFLKDLSMQYARKATIEKDKNLPLAIELFEKAKQCRVLLKKILAAGGDSLGFSQEEKEGLQALKTLFSRTIKWKLKEITTNLNALQDAKKEQAEKTAAELTKEYIAKKKKREERYKAVKEKIKRLKHVQRENGQIKKKNSTTENDDASKTSPSSRSSKHLYKTKINSPNLSDRFLACWALAELYSEQVSNETLSYKKSIFPSFAREKKEHGVNELSQIKNKLTAYCRKLRKAFLYAHAAYQELALAQSTGSLYLPFMVGESEDRLWSYQYFLHGTIEEELLSTIKRTINHLSKIENDFSDQIISEKLKDFQSLAAEVERLQVDLLNLQKNKPPQKNTLPTPSQPQTRNRKKKPARKNGGGSRASRQKKPFLKTDNLLNPERLTELIKSNAFDKITSYINSQFPSGNARANAVRRVLDVLATKQIPPQMGLKFAIFIVEYLVSLINTAKQNKKHVYLHFISTSLYRLADISNTYVKESPQQSPPTITAQCIECMTSSIFENPDATPADMSQTLISIGLLMTNGCVTAPFKLSQVQFGNVLQRLSTQRSSDAPIQTARALKGLAMLAERCGLSEKLSLTEQDFNRLLSPLYANGSEETSAHIQPTLESFLAVSEKGFLQGTDFSIRDRIKHLLEPAIEVELSQTDDALDAHKKEASQKDENDTVLFKTPAYVRGIKANIKEAGYCCAQYGALWKNERFRRDVDLVTNMPKEALKILLPDVIYTGYVKAQGADAFTLRVANQPYLDILCIPAWNLKKFANGLDATVNTCIAEDDDYFIFLAESGSCDLEQAKIQVMGLPPVENRLAIALRCLASTFLKNPNGQRFTLADETADFIHALARDFDSTSYPAEGYQKTPRILDKLFLGGHAFEATKLLLEHGLFKLIFPEAYNKLELPPPCGEQGETFKSWLLTQLKEEDTRCKKPGEKQTIFNILPLFFAKEIETLQVPEGKLFSKLQESNPLLQAFKFNAASSMAKALCELLGRTSQNTETAIPEPYIDNSPSISTLAPLLFFNPQPPYSAGELYESSLYSTYSIY